MSSHDDTHEELGGHELDTLDVKLIAQLVFGLSGLAFVACIFVAEWFYRQNDAIQLERAQQEENYILRKAVQAQVKAETQDLDKVINAVVSTPNLLKAQKAPEGWVHPDDVKKADDQ